MKLKGKLSVSKVYGGDAHVMRISLDDEVARCRAVEIEVGMLAFVEALTGSGYQPCDFDWNDSGRVGTIGENKEELVPVPDWQSRPDNWIDVALAPFRVDGWRERNGDIENHHRHSRKGDQEYQKVVFFRNVPKEAE